MVTLYSHCVLKPRGLPRRGFVKGYIAELLVETRLEPRLQRVQALGWSVSLYKCRAGPGWSERVLPKEQNLSDGRDLLLPLETSAPGTLGRVVRKLTKELNSKAWGRLRAIREVTRRRRGNLLDLALRLAIRHREQMTSLSEVHL